MSQNASNESPGSKLFTLASEEHTPTSFVSICIHTFLSVAGLTLLWLHRHFLSKLGIYLDCTLLSVMFPSFISRTKLLAWAQSRLPNNWSSQSQTLSTGLTELWQDGSLLCTLINTAVPGACPNPHRHWNKPPIHAQDLAFKYLGVIPVFMEFEYNSPLSLKTERKFFHYLNLVRNKINNISKTTSSQEISKWYIARGMGLYAGEQCKSAVFYIYPQISVCCYYNILVYIRGPYNTNGQIEFSHIAPKDELNLEQSKDLLNKLTTAENLIEKFKNYSGFSNKLDKEGLRMSVKIEDDRAKVTYFPSKSGVYEIFITSNGEPIIGSPFYANIFGTIPSRNINGGIVQKSNRKFSAEYYIRQTRLVSVQNCLNKSDDQYVSKDSKVTNTENLYDKDNSSVNKVGERMDLDEHNKFYNDSEKTKRRNILMELNNFKKSDKNKIDLKKLCHITMRSLSNDLITKASENKYILRNDTSSTKTNNNTPVVTLAPLHPKTLQKIIQDHKCASPICSDHIASEDKSCDSSKINNFTHESKSNAVEVAAAKSAFPICNNHIASQRGLSMSISDIRQLGSRRDSITSLRSFATDTQSLTCSESDFEALDSLRDLNYSALSGISKFNLSHSDGQSMVLEKKMFWESLARHPESIDLLDSTALSKSMTRLEEFKNFMKRYHDAPWFRKSKNRFKSSKSVDDLRCSGSAKSMAKFKVMDRSLEDCSKLPVDKRKENYLRELKNLEKERGELKNNLFSGSVCQSDDFEHEIKDIYLIAPQGSSKSVHFQRNNNELKKISSYNNSQRNKQENYYERKWSSLKGGTRPKITTVLGNSMQTHGHRRIFMDAIGIFSRNKVAAVRCQNEHRLKCKIKDRGSLRSLFDIIF